MTNDAELIDWEQLDMMGDGYSPDFVLIYLEFIDQMPRLFDTFDACIAGNNLSGTREIAHKIKGSAANFGFVGVSAPMAAVELQAKEMQTLDGARGKGLVARANFEKCLAEVRVKRGI